MKVVRRNYVPFIVSVVLIAFSTPAFSFDLTLPDTGQNSCYDWDFIMCDEFHFETGFYEVCDSDPCPPNEGDDFYGQDAHYTINPPDLTDNGNGTVTDNWTALVWEQKTTETEALSFNTYIEAMSYCDNLSLGGNDDWRVPTRREFSTLLNHNRLSPALDVTYFPDYTYSVVSEVYYWTSSVYHVDPAQVWKIQLDFGIMEALPDQTPPYKVRCVRGDTEPPPHYTDNTDGTVTDNVTGLMWEQKTADGGSRDREITYTWRDALAYCEDLILGTFSDWRLPNPKELERMIDLSTSNPAADTTYFPNTQNGLYWTGTSCIGCHKFKAYAYDFSNGELTFGVKFKDDIYHENFTRCVRHSDPDNDGITYPDDNCPYDVNPNQEDTGDGDGVGDACDNCPAVNNPDQADLDHDTWGTLCDNCPNDYNPNQEDTYPPQKNGIGDVCDCEADFVCDGDVDADDVTSFLENFGREQYYRPCTSGDPCIGDFICDADVDADDVTTFLEDFGREQYYNPCPACTPGVWCNYP